MLILVENLSVPFDRRVWLEATTLRNAGYTVSVICPKGSGRDTESFTKIAGIAIYRYQLPPLSTTASSYFREYGVAMVQTLRLAARVYRDRGFDVIHGCCPPDLFFLIALVFKPLGVRYVFDHHDLSPETYRVVIGNRFSVLYQLLRIVERCTFLTAHTVITTNESLRTIALTRGHVPESSVFVVRTGPDADRLHPVSLENRPKLGHRFNVAYLGVMGATDGVDLVVQAADLIVHRYGRQDIGFLLIGGGEQFENLVNMASSLDLGAFTTFTGRVSDDELVALLSASDVCVSPDPENGLNENNTMNKTMEYMAMCKPVVAFDLRETRYSAGDAALYARPNDVEEFAAKILRLIDDATLRHTMGQIGLQRVRDELAWDHSKPRLLAAYEHAFSGTGR